MPLKRILRELPYLFPKLNQLFEDVSNDVAVQLARDGMRNSWQHAVQAALDESDLNRLELKIQQAEVAIFQRINAFPSAHDGEAEALFEALRKTRELSNSI